MKNKIPFPQRLLISYSNLHVRQYVTRKKEQQCDTELFIIHL